MLSLPPLVSQKGKKADSADINGRKTNPAQIEEVPPCAIAVPGRKRGLQPLDWSNI